MAEPATLIAIAAAIFAAALIRGFTGFGFALAAVPLLGFTLPPSQCVPLAVALQFCASLSDLPRARRTCHWPSLGWLVAGTVVGSPLGVAALAAASPDVARLGIALVWWPVAAGLAAIYFVTVARQYAGKVRVSDDTQGFY